MDCLIGLDIGTTAIKGVVITVNGDVLNTVTGGYNYFVKENQKLLDPAEFLNVCFSVIKKLTNVIGKEDCVLAICSCCASGNLILLGEENKPITPIIG